MTQNQGLSYLISINMGLGAWPQWKPYVILLSGAVLANTEGIQNLIVYGLARKSYLQMLDPIETLSLRLCLGDFSPSSVESLLIEANERLFSGRRNKLATRYAIKIKFKTSYL